MKGLSVKVFALIVLSSCTNKTPNEYFVAGSYRVLVPTTSLQEIAFALSSDERGEKTSGPGWARLAFKAQAPKKFEPLDGVQMFNKEGVRLTFHLVEFGPEQKSAQDKRAKAYWESTPNARFEYAGWKGAILPVRTKPGRPCMGFYSAVKGDFTIDGSFEYPTSPTDEKAQFLAALASVLRTIKPIR